MEETGREVKQKVEVGREDDLTCSNDTLANTRTNNENRASLLFVTTKLGGGGAERHLVRIANSLQDRFDVHIAVLRGGGSYENLLRSGITLRQCGPNWTQRSTLACSTLAAPSLRRVIDGIQPLCCVALLEPAAFAMHQAMNSCKWKCARIVCAQNNIEFSLKQFQIWPSRLLLKGIEDAYQSADAVISISEGVAKGILERWPNTAKSRKTIYNAAFESVPDRSQIDVADRGDFKWPRPLIVACGRLTEQKGFFDLIQAMSILRKNIDVGLWLLGEGPLESSLKRLANRLGMGESIRFLGFKNEPLRYFAAADVFVLSSWWEGFGNVIVEAMSVGTPVVSTDCPYGPSEIIEHEKSGFLVPTKSPEILAGRILSLLQDEAKRKEIAKAGRKRAMDFNSQSIADQYARVILDVAKSFN